jgi:RES domain-containing protein
MFHEPLPGINIPMFAEPFDYGESLIQSVQEHWQVFNDNLMGSDALDNLVNEIIASLPGDYSWLSHAHELCVRREDITTMAEEWEDFAYEVKTDAWKEVEPFHLPQEILQRTEALILAGTTLFRARVGYKSVGRNKQPFSGDDIGAPPVERCSPGRSNEQFRRVLYCAEQEATAVAETRPVRGLILSVGNIRARRDLRILDFNKQTDEINPFTTAGIGHEVEITELISLLGEQFGKPLDRNDKPIEYLPTQKLAAWIRKHRFDGIRYPSAMRIGGTNLVIFDLCSVEILDSRLVKVTTTEVFYEESRD